MTAMTTEHAWDANGMCQIHGTYCSMAAGTPDTEGQHDIVITRAKLYPEVARPGPAWRWIYSYSVDGAPRVEYGTGLTSLRSMLRRKFGTSGKEEWK